MSDKEQSEKPLQNRYDEKRRDRDQAHYQEVSDDRKDRESDIRLEPTNYGFHDVLPYFFAMRGTKY